MPKKEIEAISRALQVKDSPNTIAKRKMIENSQLLSQINLGKRIYITMENNNHPLKFQWRARLIMSIIGARSTG
mgnify:FL=1